MAYTDLASVRALDGLAGESVTYTDAMITEGIAWAKDIIDTATGTSWEYDAGTVTLDGNGLSSIFTGVVNLRTLTDVTIDGDDTIDFTGWVVRTDGFVIRSTGTFATSTTGQNVVLGYTAGATSEVPVDIAYCARTLTQWYVLRLLAQQPDNALSIQNEYGTVRLAQPDGTFGPTSIPQVNAILKRHNHRAPVVA